MKLSRKTLLISLCVAILLVAALIYFFASRSAGSKKDIQNAYVVVYSGDKEYGRYLLSKDRDVTIETGGHTNVITIHENGVHMASSTCDNQDCVEQGEITLDNFETRVLFNWIVCLPNQVSVELVVKE